MLLLGRQLAPQADLSTWVVRGFGTAVMHGGATAMLAVPGATDVRGYSMFELSFVYVLFEDGTDLYWARSRVLEYLNQVQGRLPASAKTALGPDATGVGWIFQYALVDRSGRNDLSQLRALQCSRP